MKTIFVKKQVYIYLLILVSFFCFLFFFENIQVFSNSLDEYEKKLEEKQKEKEEAESYLEYIKGEITRIQNSGYSLDHQMRLMDEELKKVEQEIERVLDEIEEKEEYIKGKEEELEKKQEQVNKISDKLYRTSRVSAIDIIFSTQHDNNIIHSLILNRFVISSQITYMRVVANEMVALNTEKGELEEQKKNFEDNQEEFEESKTLLAEQKAIVQAELSRQIAERNTVTRRVGGLQREISEIQNFLILMRSGGTVVNVETLGTGTGTGSLKYFRDNAQANSFGVFSFGAYTHRNGMSQWGAWARNRAGHSYTDILKFYYPGTNVVTRDNLMEKIRVDGYGTRDFEENYLLGIREIHPSWNTTQDLDILKVQAIAARSYAVARTNNGSSSICATESCQVFSTNSHGGAWEQAVKETRGMVLTNSSGNVVSTQYAAVHGGWVNGVGYDVRSKSGSWIVEAWDNISGVSWFYRNWHTKGYTNQTCSTHPNPWLTNAEMADIVNAYLYWSHSNFSGSDSRVTAVDIATCWGKTGANPYTHAQMKDRVKSLGVKPVGRVNSVVVENSNGNTTSIVFGTDVGHVRIDNPAIFKEVYNMRAPAFFAIPQTSFLHINIEMK